ncbi:PQQ-binding-like beta-propeller repeat protein [Haladaptatus sp. DFWS20]|uniref:outer membrane protein assembly factor BamB family protein n=1 Tax=Haladaptatus sp. DFWS20 TaxID=3403467 RepID=UPI003EB9B04D
MACPDRRARVWGSPVVTNELVYVSNDDGLVFALDRADDRVRWQFQAQDSLVPPPTVGRDGVYVGDVAGTVYALPQ